MAAIEQKEIAIVLRRSLESRSRQQGCDHEDVVINEQRGRDESLCSTQDGACALAGFLARVERAGTYRIAAGAGRGGGDSPQGEARLRALGVAAENAYVALDAHTGVRARALTARARGGAGPEELPGGFGSRGV